MSDDQAPITKSDLDRAVVSIVEAVQAARRELREEIKASNNELREEIKAVNAATEAALTERSRDMQSELLRGFQSYAKGQTARVHTLEATLPDVLTRLAAVEDRVLNLETRRPQN